MDLVSPTQPRDFEFVEQTADTEVIIKNYIDTTKSGEFIFENPPSIKEKITTIESDLYIAKISSQSGGSVFSYKIKEHLSSDSNYVNLIAEENKNKWIKYIHGLNT